MKRIRRINVTLAVLVIILALGIAAQVYAVQVYGHKINYNRWNDAVEHRKVWTLRTDTALTDSYVYTDEADVGGRVETGSFPNIQLVFDITAGSMTEFKYIIWSGTYVDTDGTGGRDTWVWARESLENIGTDTITDKLHEYIHAVSGNVKYFKPLPVYGERIKIQVKRSAGTGGSVAVYCIGVY